MPIDQEEPAMPLDRHHVTAASRIMLPTYAVFFALVGAALMNPGAHRGTAC